MGKGRKNIPRKQKSKFPLQPCFTADADKILHALITPVKILGPPQNLDPQGRSKREEHGEYHAIWDTGASNTAITKRVVDECNLKPTGRTKVTTASEETEALTYFISLGLPHQVAIDNVRVAKLNIKGADMLIGMDIITRGDFAITNKDGKTTFTFAMPSIRSIDFLKEKQTFNPHKFAQKPVLKPNPTPSPAPKTVQPTNVGRNEPCLCGSGKKFKKCCGSS